MAPALGATRRDDDFLREHFVEDEIARAIENEPSGLAIAALHALTDSRCDLEHFVQLFAENLD